MTGCANGIQNNNYALEWIVRQDEYFIQIDAKGDELWFDQWYFGSAEAIEATEENKYFEVAGKSMSMAWEAMDSPLRVPIQWVHLISTMN